MNPVILPKRKEFGFLKPPSTLSQQSLFLKRVNKIRSNKQKLSSYSHSNLDTSQPYQPYHNTTPELAQATANFNYLFDPLKIKYEIKNHLLGKTYIQKNISDINKTNNALISSFTKKKINNGEKKKNNPNDLKSAHFERRSYNTETG
jgi:hypothetical protein